MLELNAEERCMLIKVRIRQSWNGGRRGVCNDHSNDDTVLRLVAEEMCI